MLNERFWLRLLFGAVLVAAGFTVGRLVFPPRATSTAPAAPTPASEAPAAPTTRGASLPPRAALTQEDLTGLEKALDDPDPATRLEAMDALVERRHVPALARFLALDPADDPMLGPTIIQGLGVLGHAADAKGQRAAVERLGSLLSSEKERNGADSIGNVVSILEALGPLGAPAGAPILERELDDPYHDTASQTAIVQSLAAIGSPSSREPLLRLRARAQERLAATDDDFARELETELLAAIDSALR